MRDIHIVDKLFDVSISSSYHLSVILNHRCLSYAILDTVRSKFLVFRMIDFGKELSGDDFFNKTNQILSTEANLGRNYKRLFFCFASLKSTLVPSPMFDITSKDKYEILFGHQNEDEVFLENYLSHLDSYLVFSVPGRIMTAAEDKLDAPQFFHQANPMLETAQTEAKTAGIDGKILASIYPGFVDTAVLKGGQLQLYNSFPYKTANDIVFYILYLYDQFKLSNEKTPLLISGNMQENGELHTMLNKYIREIHLQTFDRSFSYSIGFNDLEQHRFANLIKLFGCE